MVKGIWGKLLKVNLNDQSIKNEFLSTDLVPKGRVSVHPIMTDEEVRYVVDAAKDTVKNIKSWQDDYTYD